MVRSLGGSWRLITGDPVGVLLPAMALLLVQGLALGLVQWLYGSLGLTWLVLAAIGVAAARIAVSAPFRALSLAAGARLIERPFSPLARAPGLAVVWLLAATVEGGIVGTLLAGTLGPAWWLLARGTYWGALLLVGTTVPVIALLGIAARTAFGYAFIEVTAGGLSPARALSEGLRRVSRDWMAVLVIMVTGELFFALGSLLCGAGALPGTPYADLALLHRWAHRDPTAPEAP
jgi:hypothetical protein